MGLFSFVVLELLYLFAFLVCLWIAHRDWRSPVWGGIMLVPAGCIFVIAMLMAYAFLFLSPAE